MQSLKVTTVESAFTDRLRELVTLLCEHYSYGKWRSKAYNLISQTLHKTARQVRRWDLEGVSPEHPESVLLQIEKLLQNPTATSQSHNTKIDDPVLKTILNEINLLKQQIKMLQSKPTSLPTSHVKEGKDKIFIEDVEVKLHNVHINGLKIGGSE